nr:DUF2938 family protein [Corynebacterium anserum]
MGVGATAVMDLTAEVLRRIRGINSLDYALVGRWIGHMSASRFRYESIMTAEAIPGEKAVGWIAHYAIGSGFGVALLLADSKWVNDPWFMPAVSMGLVTVVAPWFVMQPAFGLGVAASKTPRPLQARRRPSRLRISTGPRPVLPNQWAVRVSNFAA